MSKLILVRHSITQPDPATASHHWQLTDAGRERCLQLAEALRPHQPTAIISSEEGKARLTAELTAQHLGIPTETEFGLHEHLRYTEPYEDLATFKARVQALLTHPDEQVYGEETGSAAGARFTRAVEAILARYPGQTVAAVAHGTVLSLFLAQTLHIDPVAYWSALGMPAYIVLSLPDYRLIERVDEVR